MPYRQDLDTGEWIEVDTQGNPVGQQGGVYSLPADPVEQARIENERRRVAIAEGNAATQAAAAARAEREWNATHEPDGTPKPKAVGSPSLTAKTRADAIRAYTDAAALERIADDLERQFEEGPGATTGLAGLRDYLPFGENQRFDDTSFQARGYVKRGLGFTGGEGNTIGEIGLNYGPYLPEASDRDERIPGKIQALRQLANDSRTQAIAVLGGIPDANGRITPADDRPNAMTMNRFAQGGAPTAAGAGATAAAGNIPPEMQAEYEAMLPSVMQNGRFDPAAYAALRSQLDRKYGFPDTSADTYAAWATEANTKLDRGGATIGTTIPAPNRQLSSGEQIRNNLISSPVGAAAAGALDMGGFGGVSALAPDQMQALGEEQPLPMALGQIGGAIGGTAALGYLGRNTVGRALPQLMGGSGKAQFGRNLATDVGYSGIYGGTTEGDPLTGAALGGLGSAGGQAIGKGVGRAIGGLDVSPAVQALRARGIPMTVPQQLGGFVKGVEDKAMSVPLVGDMIRARRTEGLNAFNREAFNEAGSPIGATVGDLGEAGIEQLGDQVSDAYTNATQGTSVPFDPQFQADFAAAVAQGQRLPPDLRRSLGEVLDARVAPITDTGTMTGDQFQQAVRALKATRNRPPSRFEGFEEDYRGAVSGAMDALEGQMMRGGADSTVTGLTAANAANRNLRTIEDAAGRAAGGSETGTPFMFTPSQLQRAGMKTEKRYPGARPFAGLADAGQEVLPSRIPNSGTADRAAQMLLPGVVAGGAGLGAFSGGDAQGAATGAGISTLATLALLAGGTKTGQRALQAALIDRPGYAQALGRAIRKKQGLFGAATLPLALEAGL